MKKLLSYWPMVLGLLGVGLLLYAGYRFANIPAAPEEEVGEFDEPTVDLARGERYEKVAPHTIDIFETFKGRCTAEGFVEVRAPRGMRVAVVEIHHEHGDFVSEGDPLITLNEEAIHKAIKVAQDDGRPEDARRFTGYLDHVVIRAPADGQVHRIWTEVGQVPFDDTLPLMTLTDRTNWNFIVLLPEKVLSTAAHIGAELTVELADDLGLVKGAVVSHEAPGTSSDPIGGYVNTVIALEQHEGIEEDLAGHVRIPTAVREVGLVPAAAIQWVAGTPIIRVFEDDEIVERTVNIEGGEESEKDGFYVVQYGVSVGESIVVPQTPVDY